jgi:UPF0042 nucleotide-binding protein
MLFMQIIIVTGMSGSGKSCIMDVMEDIGYYCIDNLPPALILNIYDICANNRENIEKVAIAVDLRAGDMFSDIYSNLNELRKNEKIDVKLLYVEASDEVLLKRYKETRRKHPLIERFNGSLEKCISYERQKLQQMRAIADYCIVSTYLSSNQLKEQIRELFLENSLDSMTVKVMSFGYKYGISAEADLVFDVRCLPNPFYVEELRNHTGCEDCVRDYVMQFSQSRELFNKLTELLDLLIPLYNREGKSQLVIAFGCTGGKHRSITFAENIAKYLTEKGLHVRKQHRDIDKDRYK